MLFWKRIFLRIGLHIMKIKRFNRDIYSVESLKKTVIAYRAVANIHMHVKPSYADVVFTHCKYDEEKTICEFENYLIAAENS